jgi:hypothetical protein
MEFSVVIEYDLFRLLCAETHIFIVGGYPIFIGTMQIARAESHKGINSLKRTNNAYA